MKSQDIFLLLKLVSLSKFSDETGRGLQVDAPISGNWRDWVDGDEFDAVPAIEPRELYSVRYLALVTGISKSEVSNILARCYVSGLAKQSMSAGHPIVNTRALCEFIVFGIRYVFPVTMGEMTRGIATGLTAPIFGGELRPAGDHVPVWPDPKGGTSGLSVTPLFKTVTQAVRADPDLYAMLALVDSIRTGHPRERNLAVSKIETRLRG
ncbi:MarR family transcriptional regulator [Pandoraea pulmonicola]|uniref:Uncharacterized protein n=1 Tax=Pandoraea pulmonicola TaxID=93221 RepID=A0AAJ4ZC35_PANPU|nr:MarR family transcriptional regulator [Pandoraea pulmonicola]AJC20912.1 hypothetical protein RO07_11285 [Pandoraea pulmonicola]SUA90511.1 Uncharacterised protein [Pandoraea pulmonicola]